MWAGCRQFSRVASYLAAQRTAGAAGRSSGLKLPARSRFSLLWGSGPFCNACYLKTERLIVCHFCTSGDHDVSYKELKDLLQSKTVFLIDVREKWEIGEYGKIPGSISIPLDDVVEALQMDPVHFKERYNQDMPSKSDHLVFSCMAGVRSKQALAAARSLGFKSRRPRADTAA
ncbi:thiosulfate sulfurtransferase/rhodanese-like domain-containing protein 3 isoform X2 [Tiliqua scincoides]|uniref:thiosulfate sulfurtransferase/rhodanese-like domain-containing protein 3 isoform X2 n=1 Tax=Tiliqua scincoides TaxID=71010 RepID=UPI0034621CD6